jgi:iron complex outermembrane receptor protein
MKRQGFIFLAIGLQAFATTAAEENVLKPVIVRGQVATDSSAVRNLSSSDSATLLNGRPGASTHSAGGVSGLPALRGLADDRLKIRIDGAETTAACANHMNAPLSYVDAGQIRHVRAIAGISPVSLGGDNIGGVIDVVTAVPMFAKAGEGMLTQGEMSFVTRSVDRSRTLQLSASASNDVWGLQYSGALAKGESYRDGRGDKVLDTLYKSSNHALTLGAQGDGQHLVFKFGRQSIPYQGYPNQYMDMTDNRGVFGNVAYEGSFAWGRLEAKLYGQDNRHEMGFFTPEKTGTMPMETHGRDAGYKLQAELPWQDGTLRVGNEFHRFRLDDWWPPVAGAMMMSPQTYENIVDGQRDRLAFFAEWEGKLADRWSTLLGVRHESVSSDANDVQGYGCGMMCAPDNAAAASFNARSRKRHDNNVDLTALATYSASDEAVYELGYARKTRSPNLYERYSWGRGTMAMMMVGWFGDGNGYVGDIDLKPEVAHTLSATARWHDATKARWEVTVTPYYTYVEDYIDVNSIGTFSPYMRTGATKSLLQFANHDAHLYGINLTWSADVWEHASWGTGTVKGKLDVTHGRREDGGDLYHQMPVNLTLSLEERWRAMTLSAELQAIARKSAVDDRRDEDRTAGYSLVNLGAKYQMNKALTVQAGVRNLFDRQYALPLGGVNLAGYKASALATQIEPLPGQGRSFDIGMRLTF